MKISKFFSNNSDYGFIKNIDKYKIKYTKNLSSNFFDWDVTSKYTKAKNHCAAVTSTNVDKYFCELGKEKLDKIDSKVYYSLKTDTTFNEHYDLIGNGPVLSFAKKTKKILSKKGIDVLYKTKWINKMPLIIDSIENDKLIALLLGSTFKDYHWILCTGFLITIDNTIILKIIDNWNNDFRYYIPTENTLMLCAISFEKVN